MRRLTLLLLLSGCAATDFQNRAHGLIGKTEIELQAALGPAQRTISRGDTAVEEWDYQAQAETSAVPVGSLVDALAAPLAIPSTLLSGASVSLGVAHSCRLIVTLRDGIVTSVQWAGDHRGLSGSGAWCSALLPETFTSAEIAP